MGTKVYLFGMKSELGLEAPFNVIFPTEIQVVPARMQTTHFSFVHSKVRCSPDLTKLGIIRSTKHVSCLNITCGQWGVIGEMLGGNYVVG